MRNVVTGLITLALLAGCSNEVTSESVRVQGESVTIELDDASILDDDETPTTVATPRPEPTAEDVDAADDGLFPTVVGATASTNDGETWKVDVTLSSEYDSPARYADAWRVLDSDDNELGIRVLGHDHASEQPFTRSTSVVIPVELATVFIEGRDQLNGWSGERFELTLDR